MALLFSSIATGEKPEPESLFDGKSLDRWKVIGCEVEVVDGALMMKSGNGIVLADKKYGDFIFECDWKALDDEMWDSGIYFRCEMPPEGRPWPTEYQVNMRKKLEGSVPKREETITEGLMKPGNWNHFKLTVIGDVASLEFNGKKAWTIEGIERPRGHLCLQAEVPGGGPFLFKNMTIVDLDEAKKEKESESESK
jgi:hypothetical protein